MDERRNGQSGQVEDYIRLRPDGLVEITRIPDQNTNNPDRIGIKIIGPQDQFSRTVEDVLRQNGDTVSIKRDRAELPNSSSQ